MQPSHRETQDLFAKKFKKIEERRINECPRDTAFDMHMT